MRKTWLRYRQGSRDANHASIRDGLRKLGFFVVDLASVGGGVPDLVVWDDSPRRLQLEREPATVWLELKVGKGKLRESQQAWRAEAERRGVRVATVRTLEEALAAVEGRPTAEVCW